MKQKFRFLVGCLLWKAGSWIGLAGEVLQYGRRSKAVADYRFQQAREWRCYLQEWRRR